MSDELRALAEAATPGPWDASVGYGSGGAFGRCIAPLAAWSDDHEWYEPEGAVIGGTEAGHDADAFYIAAASPDVVLALLDRVTAAEEAIRRAVPKMEAIAVELCSYQPYDLANDCDEHGFELRDIAADLLSALDGSEGASGPTTAQEGQEVRSGQMGGVSEETLLDPQEALRYITRPTMGLGAQDDPEQYALNGATEPNVRQALAACIRIARAALPQEAQ